MEHRGGDMMKKRETVRPVLARLSFRGKLIIALIAISLLITVYLVVSFFQMSSGIIYNISSELSMKNASFAYSLVERYLDRAGNGAVQIMRLASLRTVIGASSQEAVDPSLGRALDKDIRELMTYAAAEDIGFSFVNIYCANGFTYQSSDVTLPYDDYEGCVRYYIDSGHMNEGYNPASWCELVRTADRLGREYYSLVNLRILYDPATYEEVGVLIAAVDERNLRAQYTPYFKDAMILHENGQIVSGTNVAQLGRSLRDSELYRQLREHPESEQTISYQEDGETKLISFSRQSYWNVYFIIPFEYYSGNELAETRQFQISSVLITLGGLLLAAGAAAWLSKGLFTSIRELKDVVETVQNGDVTARYHSRNHDEIAYLGGRFNTMLDALNDNYAAQKEQERINNRQELRLMQAQINPHLLYNTLDSMLWSINNNDSDKTKELLVHLSSFFKISLSRGNDVVTVQKELELVDNYIGIQCLARDKGFVLKVDVPDALRSREIPKLTLQPVVENSILHGFSGYRDDGLIEIFARIEGESWVIRVRDNGIGMTPEEVDRLNAHLRAYPPPEPMRAFGLYNVHRRLENRFGPPYGIVLESALGEYTQIVITLPVAVTRGDEA